MVTILSLALSVAVMMTPVTPEPHSQGVVPCFTDFCRSGFYCDTMEERCSPCSVALCRMKNRPKACQHFCSVLKQMMTTNAWSREYISAGTSLTDVRLTPLVTVMTITILVVMVMNFLSNLVNTRLLLVMKQVHRPVKPDPELTASRKQTNISVAGSPALARTYSKPYLPIHQLPRSAESLNVTTTVQNLPLEDGSVRYNFDVCRHSNSGDCETDCDNDCSPQSRSVCHCDSLRTDLAPELPTHARDLSSSQHLQQSFPVNEETSLKTAALRT